MKAPRLARALLRLGAGRGEVADLVGDLEEAHRARIARGGHTLAALLTCLEALDVAMAVLRFRMLRGLRAWGSRQHVIHWLDVKLGARMLAKYPVLSIVAVTGMAVAIAIGAAAFSVIASVTDPALPLPEGERVVALRNASITESGGNRASLRDFVVWRDQVTSVRDVAAFTTVRRNIVVPRASVDVVRVARMTASGFNLARMAPILGRTLSEADERDDARVVVIGFEEWHRRFAADPHIIGRRVGLGSDVYTVVGVMPAGFRFPVNDGYWIPLVIGRAERERPDDVSVTIAGRLAEGVTLERAQSELAIVGARLTAANPDPYERLRPRILPYTRAFFDIDGPETAWALRGFQLFLSLLLVVVAVNVAILVYARTATRVGEIAVRTALGASRGRVVTQLFVEALVLSGTAALIGLIIAKVALATLHEMAKHEFEELPFWVSFGLTPAAITYAFVLAVVGSLIVGVVPALKATGGRMQTGLQQFSGHGARMQLGRTWTALIIAQVAVAVAVLPFAVHFTEEQIAVAAEDPGYATEEFLEASLAIERADGPRDTSAPNQRAMEQRFSARAAELIHRLESDPAVAGLAVRIPGDYERIQAERIASPGANQQPIDLGREQVDRVEPGFFALYGIPLLAGRTFVEAEARAGARAVIVNQVFAEDHLGSSAVLGRHLRFLRESGTEGVFEVGPWLEIVGVVRDFETDRYEPAQKVYLPADIARVSPPISLAIRVRVDPAIAFAPRLRDIAAEVDAALQFDEIVSAAERRRQARQFLRDVAIGAAAVMLSVLLLSAAGIYAMLSFTVTRRRREIGIRAALGGDARRVLSSIFARASAQLGAGILFGAIGTVTLDRVTGRGPVNDGNSVVLPLVALLMVVIGLLAAIGPARRGLALQPIDALREE